MEPRPPNKRTGVNDSLLYYDRRENRKCCCCNTCCGIYWCICCTIFFLLVIGALLFVFVGIPLIFKKSPTLQRQIVFPAEYLEPQNPEFSNFARYDVQGATNIKIPIDDPVWPLELGAWHLLPQDLVDEALKEPNYNYSQALRGSGHPIIVHFHGNAGNRIRFRDMYKVLRKYFHVIAFDYRGYGDSSTREITETGIVADSKLLYQWVRQQTNQDIYFWGQALGAAIATHTISDQQDVGDSIPAGLFLEAPFTNMKAQINEIPFFRKLFGWLPYYKSSIQDPLDDNDFSLNTAKYVMNVQCPIMIIHAKDDEIVPYKFSETIATIAEGSLDASKGNVTLHLVPPLHYHYGHYDIHKAPELPDYIKAHIDVCRAFNRNWRF